MGGCVVGDLVLRRECGRHPVSELSGIGELVDAGNVATAADKAVEVVTRIVYPGRRELGDCLTQCEASELDERVVNADGIATGDARVTERTSKRSGSEWSS